MSSTKMYVLTNDQFINEVVGVFSSYDKALAVAENLMRVSIDMFKVDELSRLVEEENWVYDPCLYYDTGEVALVRKVDAFWLRQYQKGSNRLQIYYAYSKEHDKVKCVEMFPKAKSIDHAVELTRLKLEAYKQKQTEKLNKK